MGTLRGTGTRRCGLILRRQEDRRRRAVGLGDDPEAPPSRLVRREDPGRARRVEREVVGERVARREVAPVAARVAVDEAEDVEAVFADDAERILLMSGGRGAGRTERGIVRGV